MLVTNFTDIHSYYKVDRHALDLAMENYNFPFMKMLLEAGAKCNKNKTLNILCIILHKDSFETRQNSTDWVDTFSIGDSNLCDERHKPHITNVINIFLIVLQQGISFDQLVSLIALSIDTKLPWAVEYFVGQLSNCKDKLHSDAVDICKLFDLLLKNFHFSTAKILVDTFGNPLVRSNPTIVHNLLKLYKQRCDFKMCKYQDCGHVTEEQIIDLTQWLIEKGLDIDYQDENKCTVLQHAAL